MEMGPDWQPIVRVEPDHNWQEPPGIDFPGKRISFASKADPVLKDAFARIEQQVTADVSRLPLREQANQAWQAGFTVIGVNHRKPPAFLRISPRQLGFGGFKVRGRNLEMRIGLTAVTETFLGQRPLPLPPTGLPAPAAMPRGDALSLSIAVMADYAELEPVVDRTLAKLAKRGMAIPGLGKIDVAFEPVSIYATRGGRLAIAIPARNKLRSNPFKGTKGTIWLTGLPVNTPGSQRVSVQDLRIAGSTDSGAVNLLLRLFKNPEVFADVEAELQHDFAPDYARVLKAARAAIEERSFGPVRLRTSIDNLRNGRIVVTNEGLYMPVTVSGKGSLALGTAAASTTQIGRRAQRQARS
jgi:Domain of unknown function (DUF4403)